ncbi:MAG: hypothetical protein WC794_01465 [Candidatus Doudnabacteria bacterium]|jgi:hypothetical protein
MHPETLSPEVKYAWVRDPAEVKKRWQVELDEFNKTKAIESGKPNGMPAEVEFFEIPQQLYDALPNLPVEDLPKVSALLQNIGSFPYAQKDFYETLKKMQSLAAPSQIKEQHLQHYQEELQGHMGILCSNAVRLEEASAALKNFIDKLLAQANSSKVYNEPDVYEQSAEQPVWDMSSSSYNMLPSYVQRAVDRVVKIYETGQPVPREDWDKYFNSSNKVNFSAITDPKEKCAAFVVALNDFGAIKNNRRDRRLPVLPES